MVFSEETVLSGQQRSEQDAPASVLSEVQRKAGTPTAPVLSSSLNTDPRTGWREDRGPPG